jgi:hypothetical protein
MISFFMTIPLSYPWANRSGMVAAPVCAPSFMVALAGEFNKFTKDMTESPVVLPVHLCVGEGAEHRVQTGAGMPDPKPAIEKHTKIVAAPRTLASGFPRFVSRSSAPKSYGPAIPLPGARLGRQLIVARFDSLALVLLSPASQAGVKMTGRSRTNFGVFLFADRAGPRIDPNALRAGHFGLESQNTGLELLSLRFVIRMLISRDFLSTAKCFAE